MNEKTHGKRSVSAKRKFTQGWEEFFQGEEN